MNMKFQIKTQDRGKNVIFQNTLKLVKFYSFLSISPSSILAILKFDTNHIMYLLSKTD